MSKAWDTVELPENLLGTEKLSIETSTKLTDLFKNINLGPAGKEAGKTLTDGFNTILTELDPE
jgi:hypothetical protein